MIDTGTRLTSQRTAKYEVGEYELKGLLGGGRIAQVFLAEQTWPPEKERHQVAIKLATSQDQNGRGRPDQPVKKVRPRQRNQPFVPLGQAPHSIDIPSGELAKGIDERTGQPGSRPYSQRASYEMEDHDCDAARIDGKHSSSEQG